MKKFVTIIILITSFNVVYAQSADSTIIQKKSPLEQRRFQRLKKKGDSFFDQLAFKYATMVYQKALKYKNDAAVKLRLAESFKNMNDPDETAYWYGLVSASGQNIEGEHLLYYAQALNETGEFALSKNYYKAYQEYVSEDRRAANQILGINQNEEFYKDSAYYVLKNVPFNSEYSDFGPAFYNGKVVFSSSRKPNLLSRVFESKYKWDNSYFLDLYQSSIEDANVTTFANKFNTEYHEGPISFYNQGNGFIFTRNNYYKGRSGENSEGVNLLKLFQVDKKDNGNWKKPASLPFNDDEYSVGHPTISEDGKILYFASDMPGGFGLSDIYVSYYQDNKWSEPMNLGPSINTEGDEMFPFLEDSSTLYFSSNGHVGLGGLDVFKVELMGDASEVENLGYPINTLRDDFGFIIRNNAENGYEGYLSSNRQNGKGGDDIYYFTFNPPRYVELKGIVVDKRSKSLLPNAVVKLTTIEGTALDSVISHEDGSFSFFVEYEHGYKLDAFKYDYITDHKETYIGTEDPDDFIVLELDKEWLVVKGVIKDKNSNEPLVSSKIIVKERKSGKEFGILTSEDGKYSFKAERNTGYDFLVSKYKFFSAVDSVDTHIDQSIDLVKDFSLEAIEIGKSISLEDILFDLNKWDIRPDAARVLDDFVLTLKANPFIIVELGTHTDSRGSDNYNLNLSNQRAASSVNYIVNHGIADNRIEYRGYGETELLNECDDGITCTDEQHDINRRAEFKVLGFLEETKFENEIDLLWLDPDYLSENFKNDPRGIKLIENSVTSSDSEISITGVTRDPNNRPISDVLVSISQDSTNRIIQVKSDSNGKFSIGIPYTKDVKLIASKEGYIEEGKHINLEKNYKEPIEIILEAGKLISYEATIVDSQTKAPLDGVEISVKYNNEEVFSTHTNSRGHFSFEGVSEHTYQLTLVLYGYENIQIDIENLEEIFDPVVISMTKE